MDRQKFEQICAIKFCVKLGESATVTYEIFFYFYIAIYNLLNINRVIRKVEVRKGREAGTIHRWFIGVLLLS
jgi:hypothetical protein